VSSADEDTNYEEGRRRHRKTLTPLSLTDGNAADNTTASSFVVENTVSYDQSQFSTDDTDSQEINRDARQHNTSSSRGRQRRNDNSEPRSPKKKPQRSSSMALPRNTHNNAVQLQLTTSPKNNRRHRSLSKLGRSSSTSHRRTSSKELRNTSYSSGDDEKDKSPRSSRRSSSANNNSSIHKRSSSSNTRITDSNNGDRQYSSSRSKSHQPNRMDSYINNSSTISPKKEKKKKDSNWSSTKWGFLSSPSNTPPKNKDGKKGKKSSRKEKKKHHSSSHNRDTKLSLLPPNQLRPAPVNVGDSIIISQQFLEDNADMSVLTMPKDLMSVISTENERNEVEVVQEDEKNHSFDTELQKEVGQLQAYLKDRRIRHQHRSTTNHTVDGSSSRPVNYQTYASRIQEGHVYSYTQDAQEIALGQQHIDDDIPPLPPPPPRPSPLSRRKTSTSTQNAAIPHWNAPATSNSNSESVGSYDDPPGELVTSPTLQQTSTAAFDQLSQHQQNGHHERSKSDPPGEEYQPFDEVSCLNNNGHDIQQHLSPSSKQRTVDTQPTPNRQQAQPTPNRLHKAVSFSLPPAPRSSSMKTPPAPPFMGPALDYYYSMERNSNITNLSQSPLLHPIIELWSSVESTSINQNDTNRWNTQKEDELLGEELPLHVSEDWIDVRHKESNMITEEKAHIDRATSTSLLVDTTASKRQMHSQFVDEDMIDDEFHDILDCGEDSIERTSKTLDEVPLDEAALDGRHRSTWSTTYKPPTATTTFDEPCYDDLHNSDNWQEVVRQRSHAAISIQRSTRGLLERERLRSLLNSTLIIQSCIRKYIVRRRYLNYLQLKKSYTAKRWKERANKYLTC